VSVSYATGNSAAAWDQRFTSGEWDAVEGDRLTRRFAFCILHRLPQEVIAYCGRPAVRILDWGCARGQLTDLFRDQFPRAIVNGLDHSFEGIQQARKLFPDGIAGRFIYASDGALTEDYDVVINSNVMEHLVDPVAVLRSHLEHTRGYYVILTPYEEPLGDERREQMTPAERHAEGHTHVQKFGLGSFPAQVGDFIRTAQIHNVEPGVIWPGYQLLVVYKRR
jgi:SAM-dependent methyltransferase